MSTFTRRPGYPLYLQLMEHFKEKIEGGEWKQDSLIPTEAELCSQYGLSKITVREAIKILVRDGKLHRIPGKGTYVRKPKLEQRLNRFFSFSRWAKQQGLTPASRILRIENQECTEHLAAHLSLRQDDGLVRIERLRLGSGEPLMFEYIWIAAKLCPDLYLKDLSNLSLNDILRKDYDIALAKAVESIEPAFADKYVAAYLGIEPNSLVFLVEFTAFDVASNVVYFVNSFYRGDRFKFSVELAST